MKKYLPLFALLLFSICFVFAVGDESTTEVNVLAKTTTSWNGATLPRYAKGKPEITILRIEIPPHSKLAWHKHPYINAGVVISGELTVVTDQADTLHLKAGDPIVECVKTWHFGENLGDESVDIIVFYAGIKDKEISILANHK